MPFKAGHPYYPGSRKGRCGRKKSPLNVMRYLTEQIDSHWGKLVEELIKQAMNGDREALMYCFDRRLGKPKATPEIEGGELLSTGVVLQVLQAIYDRRKQSQTYLITGGKDVKGTSEEGLPERVYEAEERSNKGV